MNIITGQPTISCKVVDHQTSKGTPYQQLYAQIRKGLALQNHISISS